MTSLQTAAESMETELLRVKERRGQLKPSRNRKW
jgi:hypothetical protein